MRGERATLTHPSPGFRGAAGRYPAWLDRCTSLLRRRERKGGREPGPRPGDTTMRGIISIAISVIILAFLLSLLGII